MARRPRTLLISCGALAREVTDLIRAHGWSHMAVRCLPAHYHNTPEKIPEGVRARIREARGRFERILVLYGDCGTGGRLDRVLEEEGVERIEGAHCYEFYAGGKTFAQLMEAEPGSFFLTDFLARHFERLVIESLGLDRHPELLGDYFRDYKKLVYLAQTVNPALEERARAAARRLGLAYEYRFTGYGGLGAFLAEAGDADEESDDAAASSSTSVA